MGSLDPRVQGGTLKIRLRRMSAPRHPRSPGGNKQPNPRQAAGESQEIIETISEQSGGTRDRRHCTVLRRQTSDRSLAQVDACADWTTQSSTYGELSAGDNRGDQDGVGGHRAQVQIDTNNHGGALGARPEDYFAPTRGSQEDTRFELGDALPIEIRRIEIKNQLRLIKLGRTLGESRQ